MSKYTIMAGLTNVKANAEALRDQIQKLGYKALVVNPSYCIYAVKVIETGSEQEARAARDRINKELGVNAGLKIKD